ncbi:MucR family transcriptional regulator [Modestobacter sp. VKM Ac-2986]|uniref:MucR family transcriptional regulator n=1 Tax=Modestobacter sp. VKM Ac-2986 TaxID=3004140 RepID=UPI0022AB5E69|nr:MucR family transcriptional regulator [Modestobacter sp. VKM Ac-2986]MCZ2830071.1 MucR family transcriptional regulator [Modestobacter sp. VKM Ac-2986]
MLHPVGPLPAAVYWRRRLLALGCAVGVLGGGGWLGASLASGSPDGDATVAAPSDDAARTPPGLEQVVPSLAAVQVPTASPTPSAAPATSEAPAAGVPAGPTAVGPCSDDMIGVEVRPDPPSAAVGSKPTFELVVTNVSPVACVRTVDAPLQEIILIDDDGDRVWGSNDCFPETAVGERTLQPGESVVFPVPWGGLTSEPGCAADRTNPPAGTYVLRGRLDTDVSPDATFTLT